MTCSSTPRGRCSCWPVLERRIDPPADRLDAGAGQHGRRDRGHRRARHPQGGLDGAARCRGAEPGPWLQLNAYHYQDPNRWKDLNAVVVLQAYRDAPRHGRRSLIDGLAGRRNALATAGSDRPRRRRAARPRRPGRPDLRHLADERPERLRRRAVAGRAGCGGADGRAAGNDGRRPSTRRVRGTAPRHTCRRLWNGRTCSTTESERAPLGQHHGRAADRPWGRCGRLARLPATRVVRTDLARSWHSNVRGFGDGDMGAVNGMRPDGPWTCPARNPRRSGRASPTRSPRYCCCGAWMPAWETAGEPVRTTYERGFWFRTPEAWDVRATSEPSLYMRPLSIWAIEAALRKRARR